MGLVTASESPPEAATDNANVVCTNGGHFAFRSLSCQLSFNVTEDDGNQRICQSCERTRQDFVRKCKDAVTLRSADPDAACRTRKDYINSPLLLKRHQRLTQKCNRNNQKRVLYWKKSSDKHLEEHGVDLDLDDEASERLFGKQNLDDLETWLKNQENLSVDDVYYFIFEECCIQAEQARNSGTRKTCRYSPLMLRLAIFLRLQMSEKSMMF